MTAPTPRRRAFYQRNPWLLPVLLALIIIVIIGAVLFGNRIRQAASSATPTPTGTPIVVTATPGGTPGPGAAATGTIVGGGPNSSTPLPHSTPVPTVAGLSLGMKTHPASQVSSVQSKATAGDPSFTYYLDPIKVVEKNLTLYGFKAGQYQIVQPTTDNPTPTPATGADGRPLVTAVVRYQGQLFDVQVVQPGTRGPKGIWLIVSVFQHA